MIDVVIIGGGPAGLSAGLTLGRFRRSVILCDGQHPRNAKSTGVHGFFSREGMHPQDLLQIGRDQLTPYATVQIHNQEVVDILPLDDHFIVTFQDATTTPAKKILFASGVKDILPSVEGIDSLWGQSVFHCPYCHGWEARDKRLAILANGEAAIHFASLLHALSDDIVIITNGVSEISTTDQTHLDRLGIPIMETPILRLVHQNGMLEAISFADGASLTRDAIFVRTVTQQHSPLPAKLGCIINEHGRIQVNPMGKTNIEGVYAAGDITSPAQQVVHAASNGALAAAAINLELAQTAFANTPA